jgi:quinol---cytochrome-c reductase cytochrome b subunit
VLLARLQAPRAHRQVSLDRTLYALRVLRLQRSDRAVLQHGIETGIVKRLARGAPVEVHQPLGPLPLEYQGASVPGRMNKLGSGGSPGSGSFLRADPDAEGTALAEARRSAERRALTALQQG